MSETIAELTIRGGCGGDAWEITLYRISANDFRTAVRTLKSAMLRDQFVIRLLESFDNAAIRLEREEAD